ncbi:hypothetical protein QO034_16270 [Sedimentitalea sp. JM2-8]|uniref:Uncharacterized protein n=1 Tax=Sedimentitalea xiamensis TaxID=3050037 RepID=A0ABT7FHN3_9RHOB|nr:hypothetical protein [Sedimentitalea xiamensis]MDK3074649.1 hypothetical protein [Sedimentitalea xiamensis]
MNGKGLQGLGRRGKRAGFVVPSDDPTAVDPETPDRLRVIVTIREDLGIHKGEEGARKGGMSGRDFAFSPARADPFYVG